MALFAGERGGRYKRLVALKGLISKVLISNSLTFDCISFQMDQVTRIHFCQEDVVVQRAHTWGLEYICLVANRDPLKTRR